MHVEVYGSLGICAMLSDSGLSDGQINVSWRVSDPNLKFASHLSETVENFEKENRNALFSGM